MARRGSYPHPIIDGADDVDSEFDVINVLVDPSQEDIEISYEVRTEDPDLIDLIDRGEAMHSLRWRCSATISTGEMSPTVEKRTANGFVLKAWLDQKLVRGPVMADVRVIAARELQAHSWQHQHPDYGDATFDLKPGDVLAEGGAIPFDAQKLYDPLDPPVGSCFRFVRSSSNRKRIQVTFDSDQTVDVQLSPKTFDEFKLFGHRPDLQIALVVLPALMQTLVFMSQTRDEEALDHKLWFVAIDELVEERGGWEQPVIEIAQRILDSPLDTAIRTGLMSEEED